MFDMILLHIARSHLHDRFIDMITIDLLFFFLINIMTLRSLFDELIFVGLPYILKFK